MNEIIVLGTIEREGWLYYSKRVLDPNGIAPTLTAHTSDALCKILVRDEEC